MAKACGIVDVVRAEEARDFLRHVIDFVGHAAGGEEESEALWIGFAKSLCDALVGFVPGNSAKAFRVFFAKHGEGEAAEFTQFGVGEFLQGGDVVQERNVEFRHGIQPKQVQTRHAEVRAFDGPIVKTGDAECAAVAHAAAEDFPGVGKIVAILPDDGGHVAEVAWLAVEQTERDKLAEARGAIFLELMG